MFNNFVRKQFFVSPEQLVKICLDLYDTKAANFKINNTEKLKSVIGNHTTPLPIKYMSSLAPNWLHKLEIEIN
jgi:hypothetical protein